MKPVTRYQSRLLFRKSYKPTRVIRIRPSRKMTIVFRPSSFAPEVKTSEVEPHCSPE